MTAIEWTDETWNPTRGCSRISPGCGGAKGQGGCYAERMAIRLSGPGRPYHGLVRSGPQGPRWTGKVVLDPFVLSDPLHWREPRMVFVNSMSDLFHEALSNEDIAAVFGIMASCPDHTFQVLTKRAERMRDWFAWIAGDAHVGTFARPESIVVSHALMRTLATPALRRRTQNGVRQRHPLAVWPLPNVWMGVSVETDDYVSRILQLEQVPAAVRFASLEPFLHTPRTVLDHLGRLHWVIVGGESGPGSRPFDETWGRAIVRRCAELGVPCFVKQMGTNPVTSEPSDEVPHDLHFKHPKGGDPLEWPLDLRVRQFPKGPSHEHAPE